MSIVSNAKHWRACVEETLLVARELKHEEARRVTLELALVYGRLAELAERRLAQEAAAVAGTLKKPVFRPKAPPAPPSTAAAAPLPKFTLSAAIGGRLATAEKPLTGRSAS